MTPSGPEFLDEVLPDACVGQRFYAHLRAKGGGGNYYWQTETLPPGLELDPASGDLQGTLADGSERAYRFAIRLSGSSGRSMREFELRVRRSCKFAFLGAVSRVKRLFLGDVRQGVAADGEPLELSSDLPPEFTVTSFRVTPNGKLVAYVASGLTDDAPQRLYTLALGDGSAPAQTIFSDDGTSGARVLDFAWSADSATLAVVAERSDGTRELSAYQSGTLLGTGVVGHVSDLFWVDERVCFHASPFQNAESIECRQLNADGFATQGDQYYPSPGYVFQNAEYLPQESSFVGLLTDFPGEPFFQVLYQPIPGLLAISHGIATPSPNLERVARIVDGGASIFRMDIEEAEPSATIRGCEMVQAWSDNGRYLACRTRADVVLTSLDEQGRIQRSMAIPELSTNSGNFGRSFSPPEPDGSVRWYLTDGPDRVLSVVDLQQEPWSARIVDARSSGSPSIALAFLSDSSQVLYHHDSVLDRLDLQTGERTPLTRGPVPFPLECLEDFTIAGRDRWCGGFASRRSFEISRDRDAVLFQSEQGGLWSLDLASSSRGPVLVNASDVICEEGTLGCDDQLRFMNR